MYKHSPDACPTPADAGEPAAPSPAGDPAGGIVLSGRNRVCSRSRVLAGLLLTSGIVAALGVVDTTSSATNGHIL